MYEDWIANAVVAGATLGALVGCVLLHYEGLSLASRRLATLGGHQRIKVLYAICSAIFLHVVQIWLFGVVLWLLLLWPECGEITAAAPLHLLDHVYISALMFTTVGFGDALPHGPIRFFLGTEALAGFVLIGWSVSFTYLQMEKFWRAEDMDERK